MISFITEFITIDLKQFPTKNLTLGYVTHVMYVSNNIGILLEKSGISWSPLVVSSALYLLLKCSIKYSTFGMCLVVFRITTNHNNQVPRAARMRFLTTYYSSLCVNVRKTCSESKGMWHNWTGGWNQVCLRAGTSCG